MRPQEGEEGREALMDRFTFVVQIHPEGLSTLENVSSAERVRIAELDEVGPQIQRWLAELDASRVQFDQLEKRLG